MLVGADGTVHPIFAGTAWGQSITLASSNQAGTSNVLGFVDKELCWTCAALTTNFYHGDQIGSSRMLTAGGGWPVWQGTFLPYGEDYNNPQITPNHYKFTGKERDNETGLDYFGARYYANTLGRFLTPDWADIPEPVPFAELVDPQSLNQYSYVRNIPTSKVDPDGHQSQDAIRQKAVRHAWKQEKARVASGQQGTVRWTAAQKTELMQRGRVSGFEGHHINSVKGSPSLAGNPNNVKFVEGRGAHLAEHEGKWTNATSGTLLNRAFVGLQVAQVATSVVGMYLEEQRTGIATGGPFWSPSQTIVDPTKAAAALNGQMISIDRKDGYSDFYTVKDGQYLRDGCSQNCAVNPDTLKGKKFEIVNPKSLT